MAAHSNGAVISKLACSIHKAQIDVVLAVHPALHKLTQVCVRANKVVVVHNQGDKAVVGGKLLGRVARIFVPSSWVFRPWGMMGRDGFQGQSANHINIDTHSDDHPPEVQCWGHGKEFDDTVKDYWLPYLADMALSYVGQ